MHNSVRDIHERAHSDDSRRANDETFQLFAHTAPVMIWISGVDKLCTYVNQRWLDFTGRPLDAELGNGWSEGVHPDDLGLCLDQYTTAFDRRESFQFEYRLRRSDAQYRWIFDSGVPRFDSDGSFAGYIGSAIDVTQHKLAEEALSTVSQRLIDAQEEERAWIARELHDDIGQRVSLLIMNLTLLANGTSLTEIQAGIHTAIQQASGVSDGMRRLAHRFHSPSLEHVGLEAAASAHCNDLADQYKLDIRLRSENVPRDLSREASLCLFRVLQEALQNAIRHSGAQYFSVSITGGANEIELAVHDSGIGFQLEQVSKGGGIGLSSMKERLKLVNGKFSIDSELGRGTTIRACVPLTRSPSRIHY
jgi:PAS domain S-box-containing protein